MGHKILFSGSEIMALAVRNILEENNIAYIVRDDIESAITAGFGSADKAVNILVDEQDMEQAKEILRKNDLS